MISFSGRPSVAAVAVAAHLFVGGHALCQLDVASLRHEPRGITPTAPDCGTTTFQLPGAGGSPPSYHFVYGPLNPSGDCETQHYKIDLADPEVQMGLIRVTEENLGVVPIANGGLSWRVGEGTRWQEEGPVYDLQSPWELASRADVTTSLRPEEWFSDPSRGMVLRLTYDETVAGVANVKSYEFWIKGKVLKIRLTADATVNDEFYPNYAGVRLGPTEGTPNVCLRHVPYMDSVPIISFDSPNPGEPLFYAAFVDWYLSNSSDVEALPPSLPLVPDPSCESGTSGIDEAEFFFGNLYRDRLDGSVAKLLAPIDETLNVIVTRKIEETFPIIPFEKSPYYEMLKGKMVLFTGQVYPDAYDNWKFHYRKLAQWGLEDIAGYIFGWEQYGFNLLSPERTSAAFVGADPAALAVAPPNAQMITEIMDTPTNRDLANDAFAAVIDRTRDFGWPFALYQDNGILDQHGIGPYTGGEGPYPTSLYSPQLWDTGSVRYGISFPTTNPSYNASWRTEDPDGTPKFKYNTTLNLVNSTWDGMGHVCHTASPSEMFSFWTLGLQMAQSLFPPTALFLDARTDIPGDWCVDQSSDPLKPHTIGDAMRDLVEAQDQHRRAVGGPLFGENSHWRATQWCSFESGLWDGRHRWMPVEMVPGGGLPAESKDYLVIPDYEVKEVNQKASGHHGMGWETSFWEFGFTTADAFKNPCGKFPPFPLDWDFATDEPCNEFLDAWWTNIVTFGPVPTCQRTVTHRCHFGH